MDTGGKGFTAQPTAAEPAATRLRPVSMVQSLAITARLWRNRQIASPRFRSFLARLPLLRMIGNRKANKLFRLTTGFVHTQILSACIHLGIFEALDGKALSTTALATQCGVSADTLGQLLAQAERLDLVIHGAPDLWMLSDTGTVLAVDRGLREMIRHHDMLYRDIADAGAFWRGDRGQGELHRYWAYVRRGDLAAIENAAVAPYSALMRESQAMLADCILASHDFGQYRSVLDIGGGEGAFLCALAERHRSTELALFDLPAVTELAGRHLDGRGLTARCRLHPGDFATDVIPTGHDCVTLVRILCDHGDDRVLAILRNLHRHLEPGTRLIIAEAMAGDSEGAKLAAIYFTTYFAAMGSGRCRTASDITGLLARSGFRNLEAVTSVNPLLVGLVIATR